MQVVRNSEYLSPSTSKKSLNRLNRRRAFEAQRPEFHLPLQLSFPNRQFAQSGHILNSEAGMAASIAQFIHPCQENLKQSTGTSIDLSNSAAGRIIRRRYGRAACRRCVRGRGTFFVLYFHKKRFPCVRIKQPDADT